MRFAYFVIVTTEKETKSAAFSSRLRGLMEERQMTQEMLAKAANVSQSTVHRWLHGTVPDRLWMGEVAGALGVRWRWLADGEGPKQREPLLRAETAEESSVVREDVPRYRAEEDGRIESILNRFSGAERKSVTDILEFLSLHREFLPALQTLMRMGTARINEPEDPVMAKLLRKKQEAKHAHS